MKVRATDNGALFYIFIAILRLIISCFDNRYTENVGR